MKKNILFACAGIIATCAIYAVVQLFSPLPVGNKNVEVKIPDGATYREAVEIFFKEGVIQDRTFFLIIGRITGLDRRIRAGYYSIFRSMDTLDLLKLLRSGQIIEYDVTVVEGDSLWEVAEKLSAKGIATQKEFFRLASNEDFLAEFDIDAPSFEGYLFPDTYNIPKGMKPKEAIGMMIHTFREKYSDELDERAEELNFTEREVLTLASIIEKEAITDEERPIISAVYHNRLKKRMRLQADPTAIYGVKSSREKITSSDLRKKTAYNTYVIKGLPPGPIASPGLKSIKAALYPANVAYIYFVSNNDGTHRFSVTAKEHEAAVQSYRQKKQMQQKEGADDDAGT